MAKSQNNFSFCQADEAAASDCYAHFEFKLWTYLELINRNFINDDARLRAILH